MRERGREEEREGRREGVRQRERELESHSIGQVAEITQALSPHHEHSDHHGPPTAQVSTSKPPAHDNHVTVM